MNIKEITNRYGGLWRNPNLIDYFFLVNPYFPNKLLLQKLKINFSNCVTQYPSSLEYQNKLATKIFKINQNNLVVCNGVSEIIKILPNIFDGKFGILIPTFNEYINAIGFNRIILNEVEDESFRYSIKELYDLSKKCKNIILVNPDNPSGNIISKKELIKFLDYLKKKNKNLIIDESFIDFSQKNHLSKMLSQKVISKYKNLLIIKSIGKSFGVAGIRLGIASTSNNELLSKIKSYLPIWNINSFGETFLEIMPKYLLDFNKACKKIIIERDIFYKELKNINFIKPLPSQSNYIMCKIIKNFTSKILTKKLLKRGYLIKNISGKIDKKKGEYIRLTVRNRTDNKGLISILKELQ
jgi:histidinol-phosphate/aromatic aminotransferase/cobyric acid decarboxylase-like protein